MLLIELEFMFEHPLNESPSLGGHKHDSVEGYILGYSALHH